ncbi:hypothetical protein MD588_14225 [Photobacterium sp. SDRW27]|uniref:hypothetical protein n=1 Tax=Photobacterium obscurum TaxID=2829490 RepID=UPI002243C000|nr:hypothetical protein [Photobacterium obscurum]MCW8329962.1 hypothetical protein [Photobacterium obscurum]
MGKNLDISHIVTSYELDDFEYEEFSDNERVVAIHNRWGFISEVKKQQSVSKVEPVKTEEKI